MIRRNPYAKKPPAAAGLPSEATVAGGITLKSVSGPPRSIITNQTHHGLTNSNTRPFGTLDTTLTTAPPSAANSSTFSQAFESIENTSHYQQLTAGEKPTHDLPIEGSEATIQVGPSTRDQQAAWTTARHVLYVSHRQRGNGLLPYIRNVPWEYATMVPDYIMSSTRCALFLSCKYHSLYPQYIHKRLAELGHDFTLRILLVLIDLEDQANTLLQLNKLAITSDMTLLLAWTEEEAARYLETYKALDGKDATLIQRKEATHFGDQVTDVLTTIKGINKTDAAQLLTQCGSVQGILQASVEELGLVPGLGQVKVKRLHEAFHKPFSRRWAAAKRQKKEQQIQQPQQQNQQVVVLQEEEKTNGKVHEEPDAVETNAVEETFPSESSLDQSADTKDEAL